MHFIPEILDESEKTEKFYFKRKRKLSVKIIILILLNLLKDGNRKGYAIMINQFWNKNKKALNMKDKPVTASTFCEARMKIKPKVFRQMLMSSAEKYDQKYQKKYTWKKLRVLAVDGSKYTLPATAELINDFGRHPGGNKKDAHYPQALVSLLFNVKSKIVYDASIQPNKGDERKEMVKLVIYNKLSRKDLLILDRGYPSYPVLVDLIKNKVNFLIRLPTTSTFKIVDSFVESNSFDKIYEIELPKFKKVKLRLLKITSNGRSRIFITNLIKPDKYPHEEITNIYLERWEIEEQYKKNKELYLVEKFHSKKTEGIKQEIYSQLFLYNFTRLVCTDAECLDEEENCDNELEDEKLSSSLKGIPSFKNAFFIVDRYLDDLLANLNNNKKYMELYLAMLNEVRNVRYVKRKNRHFPRVSRKTYPRWKKKVP